MATVAARAVAMAALSLVLLTQAATARDIAATRMLARDAMKALHFPAQLAPRGVGAPSTSCSDDRPICSVTFKSGGQVRAAGIAFDAYARDAKEKLLPDAQPFGDPALALERAVVVKFGDIGDVPMVCRLQVDTTKKMERRTCAANVDPFSIVASVEEAKGTDSSVTGNGKVVSILYSGIMYTVLIASRNPDLEKDQ